MKKVLIFLLSFIILISSLFPIMASATYNNAFDVGAGIAYVVSLDNGEVLFDKNFDKKTEIGSLTKIMTALLVIEKCTDLSVKATVSGYAVDSLIGTGSAVPYLVPGEQVSLMDLLYSVLVASSNDASNVVAEHVAGSVSSFVEMMNKRAKELGCKNTNFSNVHGIDDVNNYSTAEDLYLITKKALEYPIFEKICSVSVYTLEKTNKNEKRTIYNTNMMLNSSYNYYYVSYLKGLKTGSTEKYGDCIVTKTVKDGYSYLFIVMGAEKKDYDGDGNKDNMSFVYCKKIIEWVHNNIKYKVVAQEDQTITVLPVKYSWKVDHVRLVPKEEISALVPSQVDISSVYIEIDKSVTPDVLKAPIKAGDEVGQAKIYYASTEIAKIKLVAASDVKHSVFLHFIGVVKEIMSYTIAKVLLALLILAIMGSLVLRRLVKNGVIKKKLKKRI